jgi:anti-sigma factor RsiW
MDKPMPDPETEIDPRLAAHADGTLPAAERAALEAELRESPQLRGELREQERAVSLLRATGELRAPASLQASINELIAGAPAASPRRRLRIPSPRIFLPATTLVAVAIVAVVVALSGGSTAPTVAQTARLALAAATGPAPAELSSDPDLLSAHVGSVRFPSYERENGWRADGARRDSLQGRTVTTVFYRDRAGRRVGYSVVSGRPLADPRGRAVTRHGVRYVFSSVGGARLVTWWQGDHTCVIAGNGTADADLLALATAEQTA